MDEPFQLDVQTADLPALFAVCDGFAHTNPRKALGTSTASYAAVSSIDACETQLKSNPPAAWQECLRSFLHYTNQLVCAEGARALDYDTSSKAQGLFGSTIAALCVGDDTLLACNLGNSCIYLLRASKLLQLTQDHSLPRSGNVLDDACDRPQLSQYLGLQGSRTQLAPHFGERFAPQPGDVYLLCTDGLTDALLPETIAGILDCRDSLAQRADTLLHQARTRGGRDNIALILVQVEKDADATNTTASVPLDSPPQEAVANSAIAGTQSPLSSHTPPTAAKSAAYPQPEPDDPLDDENSLLAATQPTKRRSKKSAKAAALAAAAAASAAAANASAATDASAAANASAATAAQPLLEMAETRHPDQIVAQSAPESASALRSAPDKPAPIPVQPASASTPATTPTRHAAAAAGNDAPQDPAATKPADALQAVTPPKSNHLAKGAAVAGAAVATAAAQAKDLKTCANTPDFELNVPVNPKAVQATREAVSPAAKAVATAPPQRTAKEQSAQREQDIRAALEDDDDTLYLRRSRESRSGSAAKTPSADPSGPAHYSSRQTGGSRGTPPTKRKLKLKRWHLIACAVVLVVAGVLIGVLLRPAGTAQNASNSPSALAGSASANLAATPMPVVTGGWIGLLQVVQDAAPIRSTPDAASTTNILATAPSGVTLNLTGANTPNTEWNQIDYNGATAYISTAHTRTLDATATLAPGATTWVDPNATPATSAVAWERILQVTKDAAPIRSSADATDAGNILATAPAGVTLNLTSAGTPNADWNQINYNGAAAYIAASQTRELDASATVAPGSTPWVDPGAGTTPAVATPQPTPAVPTTYLVRITRDNVNIRSTTNLGVGDQNLLGVANTDATFTLISANTPNGEWHQIQYNGTPAYVYSSLTQVIAQQVVETKPQPTPVSGGFKVRASTDFINIRSTADQSRTDNILGTTTAGEEYSLVAAYSPDNTWHQIQYNGSAAYISSALTELVAPSAAASAAPSASSITIIYEE